MVKSAEASARLFSNVFVCKKCKTKQRMDVRKVIQKKVSCKNCGSKFFRPIKRK